MLVTRLLTEKVGYGVRVAVEGFVEVDSRVGEAVLVNSICASSPLVSCDSNPAIVCGGEQPKRIIANRNSAKKNRRFFIPLIASLPQLFFDPGSGQRKRFGDMASICATGLSELRFAAAAAADLFGG